jgi:hypothetical protein
MERASVPIDFPSGEAIVSLMQTCARLTRFLLRASEVDGHGLEFLAGGPRQWELSRPAFGESTEESHSP